MINDVFEHYWEHNEGLRQLREVYHNDPVTVAAMKLAAGLAWNKAIDLCKVIVATEGEQ